jgi:uncharacterized protein DUF6982
MTASVPGSQDKMNRAVVAFLDGRRQKGYLMNFSAVKDSFRLFANDAVQQQASTDIFMKDLKAVFFVRDFAGNPKNSEAAGDIRAKRGRKIVVTFKDGEELAGSTEAYNAQKLGFFMFPLAENSNNLRIFVINRNVRQVKMG